jgi:hypothetical protein
LQSDNNEELNNNIDKGEVDEEVMHGYNTRSKANNIKHFTGSVTCYCILSALEMLFKYAQLEPSKLAHRILLKALCEITGTMLNGDTGELLEYWQLVKRPKYKQVWGRAFGNENGRLAQGMPGHVKGTNTCFFIKKNKVPVDRRGDITYCQIICNVRPEEDNKPNQCRISVGGDRITYPFEVTTPTANLLTEKLLINSIILTEGAQFDSIDIKKIIYARRSSTTSTLGCTSQTSQRMLSNTTSSKKKQTMMDTCYPKFRKDVTDYRKQGFWHRNCWRRDLASTVTPKANAHQASGLISGNQCNLCW